MDKSKEHLLVIRLSALGDVAMTVHVLIALSRKYPKLFFTVVSKGFFKPVFEGIPNVTFKEARVNDVHKGVGGLFKLYRELKPKQFVAVADLHNVIRSKILDFFFKVSGKKVAQIDKGRTEKKAITREQDKLFAPLKSTHQRYANVFAELGYPVSLNGDEFLKKPELTKEVQQYLGKDSKKWIGVAPFAAHEGKMYPLDLMEEVIVSLNENPDCKILLFGGGKKETELLNNVASKYKNALNIAGQFSFDQELAILSRLDMMLSMDSGNGHLAAMYGVSVVTIWGVTHPFLGFAPYGQPAVNQITADREQFPLIPTSVYGNKVPEGYNKVMRTISPKTILGKIKEILD